MDLPQSTSHLHRHTSEEPFNFPVQTSRRISSLWGGHLHSPWTGWWPKTRTSKYDMQTTGSDCDTRDIHQVISVAPGSLGEYGVRRSSVMLEVQEVPQTFSKCIPDWTVEVLFFSANTPFFWKFLGQTRDLMLTELHVKTKLLFRKQYVEVSFL